MVVYNHLTTCDIHQFQLIQQNGYMVVNKQVHESMAQLIKMHSTQRIIKAKSPKRKYLRGKRHGHYAQNNICLYYKARSHFITTMPWEILRKQNHHLQSIFNQVTGWLSFVDRPADGRHWWCSEAASFVAKWDSDRSLAAG